ncbi:MAG: Rap1a/Tai family immunity protein [Steroidobacteraceae bacterium]
MSTFATALTVAAALLLTAASSEAPAMTAADLAQLCSGTDHVSRNACRIYILGVTQGMDVGFHMAGGRNRAGRPCVPRGISAEELETTVKQKLAALDATAGARDAAGFIADVLLKSFPCAKAPAQGQP